MMRRICIYWLCIALCCSPLQASEWDSIESAFRNATMTREDRLAARVAELESRLAAPKLSTPQVTYGWVNRTRQTFAGYVKQCTNGVCRTVPTYRTETYRSWEPVASSQRVLGVPGTAPVAPRVVLKRPSRQRSTGPVYSSTHRTRGHWTWPGDLRRHLVSEHGVNRTWAATASAEALMNEHDRLHRGR